MFFSWQACSKSAMNSLPPSTRTALSGKGSRSCTVSKNILALFAVALLHACRTSQRWYVLVSFSMVPINSKNQSVVRNRFVLRLSSSNPRRFHSRRRFCQRYTDDRATPSFWLAFSAQYPASLASGLWFHTLKDDPGAPFYKVTSSHMYMNLFKILAIRNEYPIRTCT